MLCRPSRVRQVQARNVPPPYFLHRTPPPSPRTTFWSLWLLCSAPFFSTLELSLFPGSVTEPGDFLQEPSHSGPRSWWGAEWQGRVQGLRPPCFLSAGPLHWGTPTSGSRDPGKRYRMTWGFVFVLTVPVPGMKCVTPPKNELHRGLLTEHLGNTV